MGAHALLSASSSHRWLHCPPSARLCEKYDSSAGAAALEGTDAHSLCEHKLKTALGIFCPDPTENLTYYDAEMEESANGYRDFVLDTIGKAKQHCKDPMILIEQRLDFSEYVESGFGTGDCVIIADKTLYIIDFKYGKGVPVDAVENPQMMLYALGALHLADMLYDIEDISMSIYQPRRENYSSHVISRKALLEWAENTLKPTAAMAYKGEGEFACGDWCCFCKAKATCKARAEANLEMAKYDFTDPPELTDAEIEDILGRADDLIAWAGDVKEYALNAALKGKHWDKFKLVEDTSRRKYLDEVAVASKVTAAEFDPFSHSVLGITDMTKLLGGKKKFDELLGALVIKPQGKPVLVPRDDKRPELNNAQSAASDFADDD